MTFVLAVDGGGTSTNAVVAEVLVNGQTRILGRAATGPSSRQVVGNDAADQAIAQAIDQACRAVGIAIDEIRSSCFGLAGVDRPGERERVKEFLESIALSGTLHLGNDAEWIPYALNDQGHGFALISGTGSFAIFRDSAGKINRCGGWGPLVGDGGSGYAIGLAALRVICKQLDGTGDSTSLTERIFTHWQLASVDDWIPSIYGPKCDRQTIAELAPIVFAEKHAGDGLANQIIEQAENDLLELVVRLGESARSKGCWRPEIALTGSLLVHQEEFRDALIKQLAQRGWVFESVRVVGEPIEAMLRNAVLFG